MSDLVYPVQVFSSTAWTVSPICLLIVLLSASSHKRDLPECDIVDRKALLHPALTPIGGGDDHPIRCRGVQGSSLHTNGEHGLIVDARQALVSFYRPSFHEISPICPEFLITLSNISYIFFRFHMGKDRFYQLLGAEVPVWVHNASFCSERKLI